MNRIDPQAPAAPIARPARGASDARDRPPLAGARSHGRRRVALTGALVATGAGALVRAPVPGTPAGRPARVVHRDGWLLAEDDS